MAVRNQKKRRDVFLLTVGAFSYLQSDLFCLQLTIVSRKLPIVSKKLHPNVVALYRAMRLRFGYGFEPCDADGPRNVKNTNVAKQRPIYLPPLLLVGSKELVLKVPERGQFHAAIRVARKRCDSCGQVAQGTRTVPRRNFLRCGSASEALRRNMPLSIRRKRAGRSTQTGSEKDCGL